MVAPCERAKALTWSRGRIFDHAQRLAVQSLPENGRVRVGRHGGEARQDGGALGALRHHLRGAGGVAEGLQGPVHRACGHPAHRVDGLVDHLRQPEAAAERAAAPPGAAHGGGALRRVVGHPEQHPHQRDAVGDAVVDPGHHRAAAAVVLDVLELPQRLREVERRAHERADHLLQLGLAPGVGQGDPLQVRAQVEGRVVHPARPDAGDRRLDDLLPEAVERQQPVLDERLELGEVELVVEGHHPGDEHQVGGVLHVQPGRVHVRHRPALEPRHRLPSPTDLAAL
jgi:hypothetical protein